MIIKSLNSTFHLSLLNEEAYLGFMEEVVTFGILFVTYFLGILALVQLSIRPVRKLVTEAPTGGKRWETNYGKILLLSAGLSLVTSLVAFWLFP